MTEPADETPEEIMARVARDVSFKYAARCWWQPREEIEQQAWLVVLDVRQNYAPTHADGTLDHNAFGAWAYVAAMKQISRWLWRESAPVSTSDGDAKNLGEARRAPVFTAEVQENSSRTPEDLTDEKLLLRSIERRILELCGSTIYVRAALLVFLDGETPRDVSKALGLDVYGLYRTNEWMKVVMRADGKLRELAQELLTRRMR